jgi:putative mRNA 3-end processing factor
MDLLQLTEAGLYCPQGDFYVDPWIPVPRAVVTHAHGDHLAYGCRAYLVEASGERLFHQRLGQGANVQVLKSGQMIQVGEVRLSLHPAGHILGSSQVRIEANGEVWAVSGDYKLHHDPTCTAFEPVRCHTFITEATFAMPIYRWPDPSLVFEQINGWWQENQRRGKASVLFAYALGKAQRVLASVDASIGPIVTHGQVETINELYRQSGVNLPPTQAAIEAKRVDFSQALVIAPISAKNTVWTRRFGEQSSAFVSGWMRVRGQRRRRAVDRGFVMSDHADWPGLLSAIEQTGAEQVWVTHGYSSILARWLNEHGTQAKPIATRFEGELVESDAAETGAAGTDAPA